MTDLAGNKQHQHALQRCWDLRMQAGGTAFTNTILGLASSTDSGGTLTAYTRVNKRVTIGC